MPAGPPEARKGRGATFNPANRFRRDQREAVDDGWAAPPMEDDEEPAPLRTTVTIQRARTIIARNDSPDLPFTQSTNPYQGCEHGCSLLRAPDARLPRPSPGSISRPGSSPSRTLALLREELAKPVTAATRSRWAPTPIRISRSSASGGSPARSSRLRTSIRHDHDEGCLSSAIRLLAPMAATSCARLDRGAHPGSRASSIPAHPLRGAGCRS